jgi:hypothetical protein
MSSRWTKKDYILTASIISKVKNIEDKKKTTDYYTKIYSEDNPNFDETVFRNAVNKTSSINPSKQEKRRMNEFIRKTEDEKLKKELR